MALKVMTVGKFKSAFSDVIEEIKKGNKIAVTYGKKKAVIGYFVPEIDADATERTLGILKGKASMELDASFKLTDEEFLNS